MLEARLLPIFRPFVRVLAPPDTRCAPDELEEPKPGHKPGQKPGHKPTSTTTTTTTSTRTMCVKKCPQPYKYAAAMITIAHVQPRI